MQIKIIRSRRRTMSLEVTRSGEVRVRAPMRMPAAEIERFVREKEDWIRKHLEKVKEKQDRLAGRKPLTREQVEELAHRAMTVIPQRVAYYAPLVGVNYGRITIRNQKTRWGSCSSRGNLNFNCFLMLVPPECLDYVVVHELCHRLEMNHSGRFWAEVERVLPDYRDRRKKLQAYSLPDFMGEQT